MIALGLAIVLVSPADASSVRKDFAGIWSAREADYTLSDRSAANIERDTTNKFLETARANGPTLLPDFVASINATRAHGESTARLKLLKEFEAFMATKPSASGAQAWMQGKVAMLQAAVGPAQAEEARLTKVNVGVDEPAPQWIGEKAKAAQVTGMLGGLISELTLIDENLRAYYSGLGVEQQHSRETWGRVLGSLAAGLAATSSANANQPAPRPFTMTCTHTGSFTNCNGTK